MPPRSALTDAFCSMVRPWRGVLTGAVLAASLLTARAEGEMPKVLEPSAADENIAKIVVNLVSRHHYSHPKLDDAMSEELFDEFFKRLDAEHVYFLESDVSELMPYRQILDEKLQRNGNMNFAFAVYNRFMTRMQERIAYAEARLKQPFDFTTTESMEIDRTEGAWAKTSAELDEVWRLRLKNQLLVLKLAEKEAEEANKRKEEAGETDEKPEFDRTQLPGGKVKTAEERVLQRYTNFARWMEEKDASDVMEMYLATLTSMFDPHSTYWNARTFEDFNIEMRLSFDGIGATLSSVDGFTMVVTIIAGGPAASDGRLQPGDLIVAVGQEGEEPEDVVNLPLDKVVRRIRGERDTAVTLVIQKSVDGVPTKLTLKRGEVKLSEKEAKGEVREVTTADGVTHKLGIVKLPGFYADAAALRTGSEDAKSATNDIRRLVRGMIDKDNIEGIIVDLRGNGGGYLFEAISLTGLFIKSGPVVQIRYPGNPEVRDDEDPSFFDLPLAVMVDRSTASASEIFAAAIQDYDRGIVVGDQHTHGKGTVQDVMDLKRMVFSLRNANPGALKYTVAKYYRVNGGSTQKKGVTPDIVYPSFRDYMEIGEGYLPHVMEWDEIPAVSIELAHDKVSQYVNQLNKASIARRAANPHFAELTNVLEYFAARRDQKTVSLNWDERLALRAEDEKWADRRDKLMKFTDEDEGADEASEDTAENALKHDLYVEETLQVLSDLVALSAGKNAVVADKNMAPAPKPAN